MGGPHKVTAFQCPPQSGGQLYVPASSCGRRRQALGNGQQKSLSAQKHPIPITHLGWKSPFPYWQGRHPGLAPGLGLGMEGVPLSCGQSPRPLGKFPEAGGQGNRYARGLSGYQPFNKCGFAHLHASGGGSPKDLQPTECHSSFTTCGGQGNYSSQKALSSQNP